MKKRILSFLLICALIFGMIPAGVQAAENKNVTTVETPKADYTRLNWANSYDDGIEERGSEESPTLPLIVGDYLIYVSDTTLYKVPLKTGKVEEGKTVDMGKDAAGNENRSSYTYVAAYYADGKIFVALKGGKVKAFDADTLELLWSYTDELGGQDQVPFAYSDGKIYTGFYAGSTSAEAAMVCLNAADGSLAWRLARKGGFYWSGPAVVGNALIFGSEYEEVNGTKNQSTVYSVNKTTGEVINTLTVDGTVRSTMTYDDGRVYFTSKISAGSSLYSASVTADGNLGDLKEYKLPGANSGATCTPLVYGDYVYFTSSKEGFNIVKKDTMEGVHSVKLPGYSQHSLLLSTAYVEKDGYLYFYTTCNVKPGGIYLIKVDADVADFTAEGACTVEEIFAAKGYEEYSVSSIIADKEGNLYYKNDSKTMFSLGLSKIEVPVITTDLSADLVKYNYNVDKEAAALTVTASVNDGGTLSYQWQKSADKESWNDISGAAGAEYIPVIDTLGTTYYRCVVTNNKDGYKESTYTYAAEVLVKEFSSKTDIAYAVNNSNGAPAQDAAVPFGGDYIAIDPAGNAKPRIWLTAPEEGTVTCEQVEGTDKLTVAAVKPASSKGYSARLFFNNGVTMLNRIKVTATAENGTQKVYYIVMTPDGNYVPGTAGVNVTIVDKGSVVMPYQNVIITDLNGDGKYNVDEVLVAAHNAGYTGGAEAGYSSAYGAYGLGITKLWGDTNLAYGYWLNDVSCFRLEDEVKDGDDLVAFVYKDGTYWSDVYTTFDQSKYTAPEGKVTVKIEKSGYDANWNTVFSALEGASVKVYDKDFKELKEGFKVTELGQGQYEISLAQPGEYYLVAEKEAEGTVPAVSTVSCEKGCIIETEPGEDNTTEENKPGEEPGNTTDDSDSTNAPGGSDNGDKPNQESGDKAPSTGDNTPVMMFAMIAVMAMAAAVVIVRRKKEY